MAKTVSVEKMLNVANEMLRNSTCNADTRAGMISMIETMLMVTGQYSGFRYITTGEIADKSKAGIHFFEDSTHFMMDETRRQYFLKRP